MAENGTVKDPVWLEPYDVLLYTFSPASVKLPFWFQSTQMAVPYV
jgi:hypothetical protein